MLLAEALAIASMAAVASACSAGAGDASMWWRAVAEDLPSARYIVDATLPLGRAWREDAELRWIDISVRPGLGVSVAYDSPSYPDEGLLIEASGWEPDPAWDVEVVETSSSQQIAIIPSDPWVYVDPRQAYESALEEGLAAFLREHPEPDIGFLQLWYRPNAAGELVVAWRVAFTSMTEEASIDVTLDAVTGDVLDVTLREEGSD